MKSESSIFLKDAQILLQAMADDPWEEWYSTTTLPSIDLEFLYKIQSQSDTAVWKGETIDGQYVTIESLNDYVAIGIGYTSYDRDNNIKLIEPFPPLVPPFPVPAVSFVYLDES